MSLIFSCTFNSSSWQQAQTHGQRAPLLEVWHMLASALNFFWRKSRVSKLTSQQVSCTASWADSLERSEISQIFTHRTHTCLHVCIQYVYAYLHCVQMCACHLQLTHNLKCEEGFVFKAVHFNGHLVNTRVFPLSSADKYDAVLVAVPDVDPLCIHRLTILKPGHHRFGLPLEERGRTQENAWWSVFCADYRSYLRKIQYEMCV